MKILVFCLCWMAALVGVQASAGDSTIKPEQVAVIVNTANQQSLEVGQYYLKARGIPRENLIEVSIPGNPARLSSEKFMLLRQKIFAGLGDHIQVLVMVWTAPYAVECNAITSALTLGFDARQCEKLCAPGKPSPFFDSPASNPAELGLRLSMLLPVDSVDAAKALIDRGVLSGFRTVEATAYFLKTSDKARSSRARFFPPSGIIPEKKLRIENLQADYIEQKTDVMFYQTGTAHVKKLETLQFLPGALADHLTSSGGNLLSQGQMSSLNWLRAGATASYGTVSEPCNHWQKFPNSSVLLKHYLTGASAVEAYWKSVAWPAQGLFIGEPLAAPYCRTCTANLWEGAEAP